MEPLMAEQVKLIPALMMMVWFAKQAKWWKSPLWKERDKENCPKEKSCKRGDVGQMEETLINCKKDRKLTETKRTCTAALTFFLFYTKGDKIIFKHLSKRCENGPAWTTPGPLKPKQINGTQPSSISSYKPVLFLLRYVCCEKDLL